MTVLIYILTGVLVIVSLLLVLLVLMQRPKQEGLGAAFGAGVTDQIWGSQTTNVLQKFTVRLTIAFFAISLTLSVLMARNSDAAKAKRISAGVSTNVVEEKKPETPPTSTSLPIQVNPTPATPPATPATTPATPATTPAAPATTPAEATTPAPAPGTPAPTPPVEPVKPAEGTVPVTPSTPAPAAPVEAPKPEPAKPAETPAPAAPATTPAPAGN